MPSEAAKSVSRTIGVLSLTKVLTWISSSVLLFFLPRYLGPEEYGKLYLGMSIVTMLGIVVEFGREFSVAKAISRERERAAEIVVNASSARTFIGILAYGGMIVFAELAHYPLDVKLILLVLGFALFWRGLSAVLYSFFQGIEMMKYPSYGGIIESLMISSLSILALMLGANAVILAIIILVCGFLNLILNIGFAWRIVHVIPRVNWQEALRLLKVGVPYFLNSLFGVIYYRVDTVMLSLMAPEKVVGWYGAAYRLFDVLMFVPSIFSIAVFPVLARHWKDSDALSRMTRKSIDFILLAGIPISIGTFAFAPQLIDIILGAKGYQESIVLLRLFCSALLIVYIDMMLGTSLLAADKQRQLSINAFMAIVINVGLNLWLIPYAQTRFGNGGIGAAIATSATELFIMVMMLFMMPAHIMRGARIDAQLKAVAAGVAMIISIWLMMLAGFPWLLNAIVCSLVYIGIVFASKAIDRSELALVQSALPIARFLPFKRGTS